ncbi:MAG: Gfo/Idh/MocA family protein [Fimbriimonadaceae bacterium]
MREIRFGVIGCGLMGREFASAAARWCHLLDLPFRPVIVAVCDPVEGARDWFRRNIPTVELTTDDRTALLSHDLEAVYVAVPHNLHEAVYLDVLRAEKHLMAEKPVGIDALANAAFTTEAMKHPNLTVCAASEFPFFPGAQRIAKLAEAGAFGQVFEVRAGFLHSSDLDPAKPMNWKRRTATNGEYGCMGDLGLHVLHLPLRFGWLPRNVRALLTRVHAERPGLQGKPEPCETWDNAILACETNEFPMLLEMKRIAPGESNTWFIEVYGTKLSAKFSTKWPKTLATLPFTAGSAQAWHVEDLGHVSAYPSITGSIFEFGFSDAILQMWAAFCDEIVDRDNMVGNFRCATPEEARLTHHVFTAALSSHANSNTAVIA